MFGDLLRSLTVEQKSPQNGKGNKRRRTGAIGRFLVSLSILSRDSPAVLRFRYYFETAWLMTQKNVRHFLHQRSICSHAPMIRIQDDDLAAVRQRNRTGASRPFLRSFTQQMIAHLVTEAFDLIEVNNQQIRKPRETKRIEWHLTSYSCKIAKAQSVKLKLPPFFSGR